VGRKGEPRERMGEMRSAGCRNLSTPTGLRVGLTWRGQVADASPKGGGGVAGGVDGVGQSTSGEEGMEDVF
jgi:hypothetical protein